MVFIVHNPLLYPSDLPFGVPDFANIKFEHLEPALLEGMRREKEVWDSVAENPDEPTVVNTVVALDDSGDLSIRAASVFYTLLSSMGGPQLEELNEKMAPLFAQHMDDFWMRRCLFDKYRTISTYPDLDEETRWLVDETVRSFERGGVNLSEDDQATLRDLNGAIATLEAQIDSRIIRALQITGTSGDDLEELNGLSDKDLRSSQTEGEKIGRAWRLRVSNYSAPPLIAYLENAETRAKALHDSLQRGLGADPKTDTRALIMDLANLRARRAALLGFETHAQIVMEEETVPGPEAALPLLESVAEAATKALELEAQKYRTQAAEDGITLDVQDWLYYEQKELTSRLGFDADKLRDYFVLENVINDGVFYAAEQLYGLSFKPRPDIVGWNEDTVTWEVFDESKRPVGLFMADWYSRPGKSGGAWMSDLESGSSRTGRLPVVTNNTNFTKPIDGGPVLLSWDDVETCFHEFGHALHGLLSNTYYRATAGTNVPRDFVELPSQLNEMWAYNPKVLKHFARHHETGAVLDDATVRLMAESKHFGQAYATLEYVQSALIDQAWHGDPAALPTSPDEVADFEEDVLEKWAANHPLVVPRYRTTYFAHAFAGGYDATYYSYMWAEAMVGELEEWFRTDAAEEVDGVSDGGLNRAAGGRLRAEILSRGNARPPLESFIAIRGRLPEGSAVIRRRGLLRTPAAK